MATATRAAPRERRAGKPEVETGRARTTQSRRNMTRRSAARSFRWAHPCCGAGEGVVGDGEAVGKLSIGGGELVV
eukprot:365388-Chlamydomonas_euryale.AAC.3